MKWTEKQLEAITRRGENLLVSASAGSGKTAVLANRVINYVANGGSFDRLLVVTFTRLAASEMRERIAKLLPDAEFADKIEKKRQSLLLYKTKICTIDSFFCEIVRENFKFLNIKPDFRLLDEAEYSFIKSQALNEILESYYSDYRDGFGSLLKLLGGEGENEQLSTQIDNLATFLRALPFPENWAFAQKQAYSSCESWIFDACDELLHELLEYIEIFDEICEEKPFSDKGMSVIYAEKDFLESLKNALTARDWDFVYRLVSSFTFEKSPPCKSENRTMQKYKIHRNRLKKYLDQRLFLMNTETIKSDLEKIREGVLCIINIAMQYNENIFSEMLRKDAFSFDAVSRMALSLIVNINEDGVIERTSYAENLSKSFDEILIDEYQDVNDLQDCFFSAISRNNCFAVGDVKQSIYMFRQANPDNFLTKEGLFPVIYLNKNFRSRIGILDFCNFFFTKTFSQRNKSAFNIGGMKYSESESLHYGASYPESSEPNVEAHFLSGNDDEDGDDNTEIQARFVARKIKKMITDGFLVTEKDSFRPARFSDFAVIMRTFKDTAPVYERIFFEEGVPYFSRSDGSFLDSVEVSTIFALLKTIDNPYDDLSIFATMFSQIGGFTANEIAEIRLIDKKSSLFSALKKSAENGNEKCEQFLSFIEKLQLLSKNIPIFKLIWEIFETTGYPSFVSTLPLGYLKKERLITFYSFSRSFYDSQGGSLYDFINFAENVSKSSDIKSQQPVPAGNFVRLLTVHASKGLEFPIVIVPQLNKKFNIKSLSDPLIFDISAGIATPVRDDFLVFEQTTFMRELIVKKMRTKLMFENMRLLYVAFTRGREKLILVSCGDKYSDDNLLEKALHSNDFGVYPSLVLNAKNPEELLLATLTNHPKCEKIISDFSVVDEKKCEDISVFYAEKLENENEIVNNRQSDLISIDYDELVKRCTFITDDKLSKIPAKLSVTELAKDKLFDEKSEQLLQEYEYKSSLKPKFMSDSKISGAEAGSAIHIFISKADFNRPFEEELNRLLNESFISREQHKIVNYNRHKIEYFLSSELYQHIKTAKKILKEEYFVSRIPSEFYQKSVNGAEILMQGAIDVLCDFGETLLLLDYKTDAAEEEELIKRYKKQLIYYAYAAEKCYQKPVTEIYIWSFYLSKCIKIVADS